MTSTEITRSKLKTALAPETQATDPAPRAPQGKLTGSIKSDAAAKGFSVFDCVTEGVDHWLHKSAVGRAVKVAMPLATPYLKPFVRRHYQAVLLSSAVAGALVSGAPGKSVRTAVKVAGPMLVASLLYEISKAGLRQMKQRR